MFYFWFFLESCGKFTFWGHAGLKYADINMFCFRAWQATSPSQVENGWKFRTDDRSNGKTQESLRWVYFKKIFFFLKEWSIQASSHRELSLSKWTHRRNPQFSRTEWVPWGISAKWQVSLVLIGPNWHPFPPRGYVLLPATQQSSQRCEIFCWLWKISDIISQWVPVNPMNLMAGHREMSLAPRKMQFPGLRSLRSRQWTVTPNFPVTDLSKSIFLCKQFWWLLTCFHISTSCFLQVSHFALLSLFKNLRQNASWARLSADSLLCRGLPATTVLSGDIAWLPNGPPCPGLVFQTMLLAACPSGPAPLSALVTPLCPGLSVWQKAFAQ